jgi:hypothetical protein
VILYFALSNKTQSENLKPVISEINLQAGSRFTVRFLDLNEGRFVDRFESIENTSKRTFWRFFAKINKLQLVKGSIIVFQQDYGLRERVLAQKSKKLGLKLVLMPDGLMYDFGKISRKGLSNKCLDSLTKIFNFFKISVGNRRKWLQSEPDLILSWGSAWNDFIKEFSPNSKIEIVGCPRFDKYILTKNEFVEPSSILFLSTSIWEMGLTKQEVANYYVELSDFLSKNKKIKLRLHPNEMRSNKTPETLKKLSSLAKVEWDIKSSSVAISPISTSLLEAQLLGSKTILIDVQGKLRNIWKSCPFYSNSETQRVNNFQELEKILLETGITRKKGYKADREANVFAEHIGKSAEMTSKALIEFGLH